MAKIAQTTFTYVDDLDGTEVKNEADLETVKFSLDGSNYTIDLTKKNAKALRDALAPYVKTATVDFSNRQTRRRKGQGSGSTARRTDLADIRQWAAQNGYEVGEKGRIRADIIAAYDAAN